MIRYDIYLLQLIFHPVAVVGKPVQKQGRDSYIQKRNNAQNNTKTQNAQNRKKTYKTRT
jgi:hypothetical protein